MPAVAERAWAAFLELDRARPVSVGMAAFYQPITHRDLLAYQELTGVRFRDWERRAILAMDMAHRQFLNQSESQDHQELSAQPVTPALFDALFGN